MCQIGGFDQMADRSGIGTAQRDRFVHRDSHTFVSMRFDQAQHLNPWRVPLGLPCRRINSASSRS